MVRSRASQRPCLSFLIGPGPADPRARTVLRVGVAGGDDGVEAPRLRLALLPDAADARPLALVESGLVLARRAGRELEAVIDWDAGRFTLGAHTSGFPAVPAGGRHRVRAELLDGRGASPDVLEVGVTSATSAAPSRAPAPAS